MQHPAVLRQRSTAASLRFAACKATPIEQRALACACKDRHSQASLVAERLELLDTLLPDRLSVAIASTLLVSLVAEQEVTTSAPFTGHPGPSSVTGRRAVQLSPSPASSSADGAQAQAGGV